MSSQKKKYKCPYCDVHLERNQLIEHIEDDHEDLIPEGFTATRVVFSLVNKGKVKGNCVVCGKETKWNEDRGKYNRLCLNPKCREKMRSDALTNHVKVYGKETLLGDMEHQKKMLQGRHISGKYKFADGKEFDYVGSYEHKFLEFCDKVMRIDSKDLMSPGPVIDYDFHGKKLEWITDFYYIPYNLVIEIKDGGDNPNNRTMEVYRDKQHLKEVAIEKLGSYNYIRLTNNQFDQLMGIFAELKSQMMVDTPNDDKKAIIRIHESALHESFDPKYTKKYNDIDELCKYITDPVDISNWYFINKIRWTTHAEMKAYMKKYHLDNSAYGDNPILWPNYIIKNHKGICFDHAFFMSYCCNKFKDTKPYFMVVYGLVHPNFTDKVWCFGHAICGIDIKGKGTFIFDYNPDTGKSMLGPFKSIKEAESKYKTDYLEKIQHRLMDKDHFLSTKITDSSIKSMDISKESKLFKNMMRYYDKPELQSVVMKEYYDIIVKAQKKNAKFTLIDDIGDLVDILLVAYNAAKNNIVRGVSTISDKLFGEQALHESTIHNGHEYTFDYDKAKKDKPVDLPDGRCDFIYSPINNTWNAVLTKGKKIYRVRGEVLIVNGKGEALVEYKKGYTDDTDYMTPAGSMEPGLSLEACAAKECKEELRVVPINMMYVGSYLVDFPQSWIDYNIQKNGIPYDGSITYLYVAEYGKRYNGYVVKKDRSTMSDNAEWIDIRKIKHSNIHAKAIDMMMNRYKGDKIHESSTVSKLYEAMDDIKEYLFKFNIKELSVDQTKTLESIANRALDVLDTYDTKSEVFIKSVLVAASCFNITFALVQATPIILAQVAMIFKIPVDSVNYLYNLISKKQKMKSSCIPIDTSKLDKGCRLVCMNTHNMNIFTHTAPSILPGLFHRSLPLVFSAILPCWIEQYDARDFWVVEDRVIDNEVKLTSISYKGKYLPVVACNDGIVVTTFESRATEKLLKQFTTFAFAAGNYVIIKHRDFYSVYGHLKKGTIKVKEGDIVSKGQTIGMIGKSGNSSGEHLHFELCYDDPSIIKMGVGSGSFGLPLLHFDYTAKVLYDHKDVILAPDSYQTEIPIPKDTEYKKYKDKGIPQLALIKEESDMSVLDDYLLTESFLKNPFKKDKNEQATKKTASQIEKEMKEKDKFYEECRNDLYNDALFKEYIKGRTPEEIKKIKGAADKEMKSTIGDLKDEYKGSSTGRKVVVIMALIAIGVIPGAIPMVIIAKALGRNVKDVEEWIDKKKKKFKSVKESYEEDQLSDLELF